MSHLGFSPTDYYFRSLMSNEEIEQDRKHQSSPEPESDRERERFGDDPKNPRALRDQESSEGADYIRIGDEYYTLEDFERIAGSTK